MSTATTGYDYEPKSESGIYLRLKSKGEKVRIRIASPPHQFVETIPDGTEVERFAWIVIDKSQQPFVARTFKGGPMIYRLIRDLVKNEEWGDPTQYDVIITRTEEKGKFYTVMPSPKKSEFTAEEREMLMEANFDLVKLYAPRDQQPAASPANNGNSQSHEDDYDPLGDEA